jgi:hypothetical protein
MLAGKAVHAFQFNSQDAIDKDVDKILPTGWPLYLTTMGASATAETLRSFNSRINARW